MNCFYFFLFPPSASVRSMVPNLGVFFEVEVDGAPQGLDEVDLILAYRSQFLVA